MPAFSAPLAAAPASVHLGLCRSCGARILWARTSLAKSILLDADPVPLGNLALDQDGRARVVPQAERRGLLYRSHFVTCSTPEAYRRK